jgi:putative flippase GtrA
MSCDLYCNRGALSPQRHFWWPRGINRRPHFCFAAVRKRSNRMPMVPTPRLTDRLIAAWHERAIVLKAASFAAVGLVNSAVDFGVFSFAYYYLKFPIVLANVVSWSIAVSGSYVMNSLTTFARESGRELRLKSYASFALSQAAGLVANTATVIVASYFMPVLVGKVFAIGASFMVNFTLSHFVVFRRRQKPAPGGD